VFFAAATSSRTTSAMDCPNLVANARHLSPMRAKLLVLKQGLRGMMHEPVSLVGAWLKRVAEGYCRRHAVPGSVCLQHRHARLQGTHHPAIAGGKSTAPVYCRHLSCREPLQDSGFRARVPNLLRASNPLTTGSPGFTYGSLAPQDGLELTALRLTGNRVMVRSTIPTKSSRPLSLSPYRRLRHPSIWSRRNC
jgi:hypothetical protein